MITYNEVKQLLNQGIFPCLIHNGEINYILFYDDDNLSCGSFYEKISYTAESENSELSLQLYNGGIIDDGGGGMVR